MKPRTLTRLLAVLLAAAAPVVAQEKPLVAGENGVPVPKKTKHVQPEYPPEALAQGIRGIVILDLVVDTNGKVVETNVLRGIPGLDEAAIAAARGWEFEPLKVAGKPVSVRLTQGITFALQLPRITREPGVPELRQGVPPKFPGGSSERGAAAAEVSLEADGRVGSARIVEGDEPWAGALLAALQTWRFGLPPEDADLSFTVRADFVPARDSEPARVLLKAGSLRKTDLLGSAAVPATTPAPATATPAPATSDAPAPAAAPPAAPPSRPEPTSAPQSARTDEPPPTKPTQPPPVDAPDRTPAPPEERHPATPPPGAPAAPGSVPDALPVPPSTPQQPAAPGPQGTPPVTPPSSTPPAAPPRVQVPSGGISTNVPPDPTAPPPVEVITAPPPQQPPENGISAIRDITLEPGVPDLTQGRRPVAPPLARMANASGTVNVQFSVSAAGGTAVQSVAGPDLLKKAAEQAVASWVFRRTRADRAYLSAVFTFDADKASAVVRPQPAPPDGAAHAELPAQPAQQAPAPDTTPGPAMLPPVRPNTELPRPPMTDDPPPGVPGMPPPQGLPPSDPGWPGP